MKITIVAAITALFLAGTTGASLGDTPSPSNLTLKVGGSFESSSASGSNFAFAVGGEYAIHPASTLEPFNASIYVDSLGRSTGGGFSIRNAGNSYIGGGVGYYAVSVSPPAGCAAVVPGEGCTTPTYSSSGFGGKLFAGLGVAPATSLEIGYHFLPNAGGYQTNTVTAQLAIHF